MAAGTIRIVSNAGGNSLVLVSTNPSPPPQTLEFWIPECPGWLWDAVKGNAGRHAEVEMSGTPPTPQKVTVS